MAWESLRSPWQCRTLLNRPVANRVRADPAMKHLRFSILVVLTGSVPADESPSADDVLFFETKIRPVLVQSCYQCHSEKAVAAKQLQGKLLLDSRDAIRKGGESGPAVVPGNPESSLLISAIKHDSFEMPPPRVAAAEKNVGSFQPLQTSAPPKVNSTDWAITDIDHFILAQLEKRDIVPNSTADRMTLTRRLYF